MENKLYAKIKWIEHKGKKLLQLWERLSDAEKSTSNQQTFMQSLLHNQALGVDRTLALLLSGEYAGKFADKKDQK